MKNIEAEEQQKSKAEYNQGSVTNEIVSTMFICGIAIIISFVLFHRGGGFASLIMSSVAIIAVLCRADSIKSEKATFNGKCPHCNQGIWINAVAYPDGSKFNCPLCGKAIKLSNQYFCAVKEEASHELSSSKSNLQRIKELKELLDLGAITQAEYENKKTELLNRE